MAGRLLKLTELMLGSEQERALRRAADAAVWATAREMSPTSGGQAGQATSAYGRPVTGGSTGGWPIAQAYATRAGIAFTAA